MKSLAEKQGRPVTRTSRILIAAGIYNLLWGVFVIARPETMFRWAGFEPLPNYPELWQCLGMVIGVYGVGYLIAATDRVRHWPIVLVGLLGKVLGPLGFAWSAASGHLPWRFGAVIVTNDLVWWIPFGLLLAEAWTHHRKETACRELQNHPPQSGQISGA